MADRLTDRPRGIDGLTGRDPIGGVLTLGRKALPEDVSAGHARRAGQPIRRERFYLMQPDPLPVQGMRGGARRKHPTFGAFNRDDAPDELRARVLGRLVHVTEGQAWTYNMRAQAHPDDGMTPSRRPWCEGNGGTKPGDAHRISWDAEGNETINEIECPGERCPFRQGRRPACSPYAQLMFQIGWDGKAAEHGWPSPLVRWSTRSWHSIRNVIGFFERIHESARGLGLTHYGLQGLRFEMTVQPRTSSKDGGRRFPVVRLTPLDDPASFFATEALDRARLAADQVPLAITDQGAQAEADDWQQNVPGLHTDAIDAEVTDGE